MNMIERVAKAIYEKACERASGLSQLGFTREIPTWDELQDPDRSSAMGEARAAVAEMMEPSDEMESAGWEQLPDSPDDWSPISAYERMIKAALEE